jgi:hypothetical protein
MVSVFLMTRILTIIALLFATPMLAACAGGGFSEEKRASAVNSAMRANGTRTGAVYANECGQAGFVTLSMPIREARENIVFKHKFIKACFVKMDNIIRQDEASRICLTDNLGGL